MLNGLPMSPSTLFARPKQRCSQSDMSLRALARGWLVFLEAMSFDQTEYSTRRYLEINPAVSPQKGTVPVAIRYKTASNKNRYVSHIEFLAAHLRSGQDPCPA